MRRKAQRAQEKWVDLPDGIYTRRHIHSNNNSPYAQLMGLLPKHDPRFKHVVVEDSMARVVAEIEEQGPEDTPELIAERLRLENEKLRAKLLEAEENKASEVPPAPPPLSDSGDEDVPPDEQIAALSYMDAKKLCKAWGLSSTGVKSLLIQRLLMEAGDRRGVA